MQWVHVLYKFHDLLIEHMEDLTYKLCRENDKNWNVSLEDLLKVKEPVEIACGCPSLMIGETVVW